MRLQRDVPMAFHESSEVSYTRWLNNKLYSEKKTLKLSRFAISIQLQDFWPVHIHDLNLCCTNPIGFNSLLKKVGECFDELTKNKAPGKLLEFRTYIQAGNWFCTLVSGGNAINHPLPTNSVWSRQSLTKKKNANNWFLCCVVCLVYRSDCCFQLQFILLPSFWLHVMAAASVINPFSMKWDPKSLEIRTRSVEKTLEPLVIQVRINIILKMLWFLCDL